MPDRGAVDLLDRPAPVEDAHARTAQQSDDLRHLVAVPVVIPENRVHGHLERPADLGEQRRLLGLAVGRQVACEQDEVDGPVNGPKGGGKGVAVRLIGVHVACRGDTNRPGHARHSTD